MKMKEAASQRDLTVWRLIELYLEVLAPSLPERVHSLHRGLAFAVNAPYKLHAVMPKEKRGDAVANNRSNAGSAIPTKACEPMSEVSWCHAKR